MAEASLVPNNSLALNDPEEDLLKRLAEDIGKDTAAYIEVMYPEAVKASSSTFLLSLRNHIHNQIVSAVREAKMEASPEEWFARREAFRKRWVASYRKMRRNPRGLRGE